MKDQKGIFELVLSMLPSSHQTLDFDGEMKLDDNLSADGTEEAAGLDYSDRPMRVTFSMLLFCREGSFSMRINLRDYEVQKNEMLLVPPGSILDQACVKPQSRLVLMCQNYDQRQNHPFEKIELKFMLDYKGTPWHLKFTPFESDRLVTLYQEMRAAIQDEGNTYRRELLTGYRYALGAFVTNAMERQRHSEESAPRLSREDVLFREFIRLVHTHYSEHREVAFYAEKMCITPKYLSVVVSKASHRTPSDWIRDYVILDAKSMILSGDYSIQQVSDMLHFANPSFFGKYFKEAVGCAPGHFAGSPFSTHKT